jgi:hypothetical protein
MNSNLIVVNQILKIKDIMLPFDLMMTFIVPIELVVAITTDVLQYCISVLVMFSSSWDWKLP